MREDAGDQDHQAWHGNRNRAAQGKCLSPHRSADLPKWLHRAYPVNPPIEGRNCHDNAVAESFFQLLKRERIRRKIYNSRDEARQDVFDHIEMFYNPKRRHGYNKRLSPVDYEKQYFKRLASV